MRKIWIVASLAILANLIGAYFGFFTYYAQQLSWTPPELWVFVADCPLAVLLFAGALLFFMMGWRNGFFPFLASAYCLKYGIWTVSVILYFHGYFFSPEYWFLYAVMLVTHAGMTAEAFAFVGKIRVGWKHLAAVLGWFLLNDLMDYWGGLRPQPVPESGLLFPFTLMLTFVAVPLLYLAYREGWPTTVSKIMWWK